MVSENFGRRRLGPVPRALIPLSKRLVASCPRAPPLLPSARQRASILGSRAVADKATALGVSESGTLPARACAVGAGGPRQGLAVACADRASADGGRLSNTRVGDSLVTRGNRTVRNCRPV